MGEGEAEFPFPFTMLPPSTTVFCQRTFPVARSMHSSSRFFSASGDETKIESPQIAGVAPLKPGSGVVHFTFSRDQVCGSPFSGDEPLKAGPRHCGQFSACTETASAKSAQRDRE